MKTEKKTGCYCDKEAYHELICGRLIPECNHCDIPMSECSYFIHRFQDKEVPTKTWKDYLLGFFTSVVFIFLTTSLYAMQPQDFAKKYETYAERIEYHSVNGHLFKTFYYYKWKSNLTNEKGETTYKSEVEENPTAWMITGAVMTEIGILFMPLICTEMVENVPCTVYLSDSPQFKHVMPEREI